MNIRVLWGLLIALSHLSAMVRANELRWIKLEGDFSYQDQQKRCHTMLQLGEFYAVAEFSGAEVTRITFKDWRKLPEYELALQPEEITDVELWRDVKDRVWLSSLTPSPRMLQWIFANIDTGDESSCHAPRLATIGATPGIFSFELEGVKEEILLSYSGRHKFGGKRWDGMLFEASLRLRQMQYTPGRDF